MSLGDLINCLFEYGATLCVGLNIYKAWVFGGVRGVSRVSCLFFLAWSAYSVIFFGTLDQPFSLMGAVGMALANLAWTWTVFRLGAR